MKTLIAGTTIMMLLSAAPALAMTCCGGGKSKGAMMCGKGSMAMTQGSTKGKKGGCCCDGMNGGNMSKRT
jgi:hypothetical protein